MRGKFGLHLDTAARVPGREASFGVGHHFHLTRYTLRYILRLKGKSAEWASALFRMRYCSGGRAIRRVTAAAIAYPGTLRETTSEERVVDIEG